MLSTRESHSGMRVHRTILVLTLLLCHAARAEPTLTAEDFAELKALSEALLKRYPPDQYYFVGVGRSPDPLITLMELGHPDCCSVVPYSSKLESLRGMQLAGARSLKWARRPYDPVKSKEAFAWLDHYFPKPEVIKGRKVVPVDYASLGLGLGHFSALLETYKEQRNLDFEQSPVGLTDGSANPVIRAIFRGIGVKVHLISLNKYPTLLKRLENSELKALSRSPEVTEAMVKQGPGSDVLTGNAELIHQLREHLQRPPPPALKPERGSDACLRVNQAT